VGIAMVRLAETLEHLDSRRFTSAILAENRENLAATNAQRQIVDDSSSGVSLGEVLDING
jgi:hypothetical protein